MVRTMTSMWEGQEAQGRQLAAKRLPVFHGEDDVMVASDVEDREAGCLHGIKDRKCREDRVGRLGAEVGACKLDRYSGTAAVTTLRNSLQRALGCRAARLRLRLEEQCDLPFTPHVLDAGLVVEELLAGFHQRPGGRRRQKHGVAELGKIGRASCRE